MPNYYERLEHTGIDNCTYILRPLITQQDTKTFRMEKYDSEGKEIAYKYLRVDVYEAEDKGKKEMDLVVSEWENFVKENGGV